MGGNIVLNLIKTTFAGIIVIVLCIVLAQKNDLESRLRSVQEGQTEQQSDSKAVGRQLDRLQKSVGRMDKRLQALDKVVREGGIAIRTDGDGAGGGTLPPDPDVDPRTLPLWDTEDNVTATSARRRLRWRGGVDTPVCYVSFSIWSLPPRSR